jgi:hypothetical protein
MKTIILLVAGGDVGQFDLMFATRVNGSVRDGWFANWSIERDVSLGSI